MAGEPSWFEIGVKDADRARTFYGELFGWTFEDTGQGAVIRTPGLPGGLHGGDEGAVPYLFFSVADLAAAIEKVRALGGQADTLPGGGQDTEWGSFALCKDDQGSSFGLHQPGGGA
jgi:predicted enzyme related to lactoylglutathione lyase